MASAIEKRYPAYAGSNQYVFFAFSSADASGAEKILKELRERRCRVWYAADKKRGRADAEYRQLRMNHAALTVLYLTDNAVKDTALKGDVLYLIANRMPVIVLTSGGVSNLAMGLPENLPAVGTVGELVRTEGFTMDLIGDEPEFRVKRTPAAARVLAVLAALGILAAAGAVYYRKIRTENAVPPEDRESVTEIYLKTIPEDTSFLDEYPALERIRIPQSQADAAAGLISDYTIVLS